MAAATPMDQFAALAGTFGKVLSIGLPERRPPDARTLAHSRAAEWVQKAAGWMLHGADLSVVTSRTPFTAETAQDLWRYYESLPLDQRVDRLVLFFIGVELMQSCGILTREQFPRLRRMIDVYTGALATTCLMPRRVFYTLHRAAWSFESYMAKREIREPEMPLLLSSEAEAAVTGAVESALDTIRGSSGLAGPTSSGSSSPTSTSWVTVLMATSAGVGAMVWWIGIDNLQEPRRALVDRWLQLEHRLGIKPRYLQQ